MRAVEFARSQPDRALRALIVGGGAVSERYHIPAAIELFGVDNICVVEPDEARRAFLVSRFQLRHAAPSHRESMDWADCVIVATPPHLHAAISIECMEARLPVLCEKPLANTSAECEAILEAVRRTSQVLGVCHSCRYFPNREQVRERLKGGEFGGKLSIEIVEGAPTLWPTESGYTFRKELVPGGVLLNSGIHSLDFILWCLGQPEDLEYRDDSIGGLESNAEVKMRFANDSVARLRISRTAKMPNMISVAGEKRSIRMPLGDPIRIFSANGTEESVEAADSRRIRDSQDVAIAQLNDFQQAAKGVGSMRCGGAEGAAAVEVIERCYTLKRSRPLPTAAPIPGLMW